MRLERAFYGPRHRFSLPLRVFLATVMVAPARMSGWAVPGGDGVAGDSAGVDRPNGRMETETATSILAGIVCAVQVWDGSLPAWGWSP